MRRTRSHSTSKTCRICGNPALARELCSKHYQRAWQGRDPEAYTSRDPNPIRVGKKFAYIGIVDKTGKVMCETVIDVEDVERVREYKWNLAGQGRYICSHKAPGRYLHRFLLGAPANRQVDHINGKVWDNRKINLRLATPKLNIRNSIKSKKGKGHRRGVWYVRKQRSWAAAISLYFDSKQEAVLQREMWEALRDKGIHSLLDLEGVAGWSVQTPG